MIFKTIKTIKAKVTQVGNKNGKIPRVTFLSESGKTFEIKMQESDVIDFFPMLYKDVIIKIEVKE